jgi:hypothetical protein
MAVIIKNKKIKLRIANLISRMVQSCFKYQSGSIE